MNYRFLLSFVVFSFVMIGNTTAQLSLFNIEVTRACGNNLGSIEATLLNEYNSLGIPCDQDAYIQVFGPNEYFYEYYAANLQLLNFPELQAGNYSIVLTGAGSCSGLIPSTYNVTVLAGAPVELIVTPGLDVCKGIPQVLITCSGGQVGISNVIYMDGGFLDIIAIGTTYGTGVGPGDHTVTGHNDECLVPTSYNFTAVEPDPITITHAFTQPSSAGANDGNINITVTGGTPPYTYLWSNGSTLQDVGSLFADDYNVRVTDSKSCFELHDINLFPVGIYDQSHLDGALSILSNPIVGSEIRFNFDVSVNQKIAVSVINAVGAEVGSPVSMDVKQGANSLSYPINATLASGMYLLQVTGESRVAQPFIIKGE